MGRIRALSTKFGFELEQIDALETIDFTGISGLCPAIQLLSGTYRSRFCEYFMKKQLLIEHFRTMFDFLLFVNSAFIEDISISLQEYLEKPAAELVRSDILAKFELILLNLSAQYDENCLSRVDLKLHEVNNTRDL